MKSLIILIVFLFTTSVNSQSVLTKETGTSIGVFSEADLCVNIIYGGGILYGNGTICGGSISVKSISTEIPDRFDMKQNYPNPFNPTTVIKYQLPKSAYVSLKVYDILGKEAEILIEGTQKAGYYEVTMDASNLSSGIYFCRIKAGDYSKVIKMNLIK